MEGLQLSYSHHMQASSPDPSSHTITSGRSRACGSNTPLLPATCRAEARHSSIGQQGGGALGTSSCTHINVTCGPVKGILLLDSGRVIVRSSTGCHSVSPTRFERMGGMG